MKEKVIFLFVILGFIGGGVLQSETLSPKEQYVREIVDFRVGRGGPDQIAEYLIKGAVAGYEDELGHNLSFTVMEELHQKVGKEIGDTVFEAFKDKTMSLYLSAAEKHKFTIEELKTISEYKGNIDSFFAPKATGKFYLYMYEPAMENIGTIKDELIELGTTLIKDDEIQEKIYEIVKSHHGEIQPRAR